MIKHSLIIQLWKRRLVLIILKHMGSWIANINFNIGIHILQSLIFYQIKNNMKDVVFLFYL